MQLNTSYVCTDPKGEILQATGKMLIEAGYELKVFNLIEMEHSNNYNPFHYVYDYDGNLVEANVTKMIDVFMKNTKGEGEKEDFWSQKATELLTAIILLLFGESEYNGERDFSQLNFFSATEKMRKLVFPAQGGKDGFFLEREAGESDEAFLNRREAAFLCPLDRDFIELERRKGETLATRLYKGIRSNPQETGQSIVSTASARTQMFNLSAVADLTCCDNIRLETLGDRKTALFIIIPATDATFNFLAAMMYTQMFDVLANRANFKYGGTLPTHVRCIMDEFSNIGQIPDFDRVIAFVRSMGMSLNVIIQNLAQLKARYEKTWEVITGNCDSLLFLGGKEESTLKSVSEALGKETIDVEARNRTKAIRSNSTSESNSILGRELMTPSELAVMPISSCILMVRAQNPFYCDKFPIEQHPNFHHLEDFDEKNTFDKSSVHTVTLEEFTAENKKIEIEQQGEEQLNEKTKDKMMTQIYPSEDGEPIEVTAVPVEVDSYAEAEIYGGTVDFDVDEDFADGPRYGTPSELSSVTFSDIPNPEYKEMSYDDVDADEENDTWVFAHYGSPHEGVEQVSNLDEQFSESILAGHTETYAPAINRGFDLGLYGVDEYAEAG
jgi:type IV secretion system protein VirD4